jgi:allantoinase
LTLMARYCAERPARHHGLAGRKGAIEAGKDADFVVIEPGNFEFDEAEIQDRAELRWSPYQGRAMRGRVAATLLRGQVIWDGAVVSAAPGTGQFLRRGVI